MGYFKSLKHHSRNHKHWEKLRNLSAGSVEPRTISVLLMDSLLLVVQLVSYKVFSDFIFSIKNFDMKGMNAIAREVLNLSC
jgi:hypothetical protein